MTIITFRIEPNDSKSAVTIIFISTLCETTRRGLSIRSILRILRKAMSEFYRAISSTEVTTMKKSRTFQDSRKQDPSSIMRPRATILNILSNKNKMVKSVSRWLATFTMVESFASLTMYDSEASFTDEMPMRAMMNLSKYLCFCTK